MKALFLGVDVGTTTVKSALFDERGRELRLVSRNMQPKYLPNGRVMLSMEKLWDCVADIINETIAGSESLGEIIAIGVTAMGDGLWLLDDDGRPITDATLWVDGRAVDYINRWQDQGVIQASGRVVFAGSPLPLSAWYFDHMPLIMEQCSQVLFCKDWIKYCLTGIVATDQTDLSDASVIDVWSRNYSIQLLEKFGVPKLAELLPPIHPCTEIVGNVTKPASEKTGLPKGIPVVNGSIDVVASAIGTGVIDPLQACTVVGTTVYNSIVVDETNKIDLENQNAPSLICHAEKDLWLLSMGTMLGTPNLDWFIREFYAVSGELPSFATLEDSLKSIGPGADGIIFHPYLGQGGERAPFVKPSAAAQFFGLKSHHTREHMLLAVYEGIGFSMKDCYKHLPVQPKSIRIVGGGSASKFWCDIFANCAGMPVQVTYGKQVGALGAAILAAVGVNHFSGLHQATQSMVRIKDTYEPDPAKVKIFEESYALYKRLYESVWDLWDERDKLWKAK
jgi:sugar (pentulose or hexulose) kinase